MTLDEFVAEEQARITAFRAAWLRDAQQAPEQYPMDLEPGDWDEQFRAFAQTS